MINVREVAGEANIVAVGMGSLLQGISLGLKTAQVNKAKMKQNKQYRNQRAIFELLCASLSK